jgi:hypothetical protein
MRFESFCITILAAASITCAAAGTDVFGQGRGRGNAGSKATSPYIGPPIVNTERTISRTVPQRRGITMVSSQPGRHRGWKHKKYTYGYRNYGEYRRTQVGNRRFRTVKRYYCEDGPRRSRLVRVYL